jgi:hypothetical protein
MVRFNRRRLRARKLARPERPAAPLEPISLPENNPLNGASTEVDVQAVRIATAGAGSSSSHRSQESTVEIAGLQPQPGRNGETADGLAIEPEPPQKMEFVCPCGARLIATTETYDKHTRCAMCQTVMLISLVYDPEKQAHEIVPFRVDPESGP